MARPKREFSKAEITKIQRYALQNSKTQTIADALNIPYNTLNRHFGRRMTIWRAEGKVKLKSLQRKMADKSPQMAIWLGKQDLDQVDKQIIKTETDVNKLTPDRQAAIEPALKLYKSNRA